MPITRKRSKNNEKYIEVIKDPKNKAYDLWRIVCSKHHQRKEAIEVRKEATATSKRLTNEINALMEKYNNEVK